MEAKTFVLPLLSNTGALIANEIHSFLRRPMTVMSVTRTIPSMRNHVAIYAGSFDPITSGHLDVISRARGMFDTIIVGVGDNPEKQALFPSSERVSMARKLVEELVENNPNEAPVTVEQYSGLTVDFARDSGGVALIRGIRNVTDLANETQLAITNRQVADLETVFIVTGEAFAFTSSSLIRQIAALGGDVERLHNTIPPLVIAKLKALQDCETSSLHVHGKDAHMD